MTPREPRKLAAILAADVAGYSRLMGSASLVTVGRVSKTISLVSAEVVTVNRLLAKVLSLISASRSP